MAREDRGSRHPRRIECRSTEESGGVPNRARLHVLEPVERRIAHDRPFGHVDVEDVGLSRGDPNPHVRELTRREQTLNRQLDIRPVDDFADAQAGNSTYAFIRVPERSRHDDAVDAHLVESLFLSPQRRDPRHSDHDEGYAYPSKPA